MHESRYDAGTGTMTFTLTGRMDTERSTEARGFIMEKIAEVGKVAGLRVVLDIKGVDYVSSAFIRVCMEAAKAVGTDNFSIENTNPAVKKILKMAGIEGMVRVQ